MLAGLVTGEVLNYMTNFDLPMFFIKYVMSCANVRAGLVWCVICVDLFSKTATIGVSKFQETIVHGDY